MSTNNKYKMRQNSIFDLYNNKEEENASIDTQLNIYTKEIEKTKKQKCDAIRLL